jgi:lichenan operon transcriptional antiterminator
MEYGRQKNIFLCLLNSLIGLSGKELAGMFGVSSRTIRSDVKFLNDFLKGYGIRICSSKRQGYFIPSDQKDIALSIAQEVFGKEETLAKLPVTPSERFIFILLKLAFARDYISMEDFAEMLFVSKTAVYLDVKNIISFLEDYVNLQLEISPIKGLRLNGDERAKRFLISNVLKRDKGNEKLMLGRSLCYIFADDKNLNKDILFLYETIINILNKFGYILTDDDVNLLVKDIFISIKRIEMGFAIEDETPEDEDLTIAKAIKHDIGGYFNVSLDKGELEYIQQSFNTKRVLDITGEGVLKEDAEDIVDEFINVIKNKFNIDFAGNVDFKRNLLLHISPMIERIKADYFEENPLKNQIKTNYPFAFEIATLIVPIIKGRLKVIINEAEVSYIAMHVAVALDKIDNKTNIVIICGSGLGTAQFVNNKVASYYGERVNILGYYPVYKLDSILDGEYGQVDLIISTIPIVTKKNIPVVQVNPLITDDDLNRLKYYIGNPRMITNKANEDGVSREFFRNDLFVFFEEETDFYNVVLKLSGKLKMQGYIDDIKSFYSSVVKREKLFSTALDNMVAIPHSMESMSKRTVVAVGVLKNPVVHDEKKVKIILLIAFNVKEDEKIKRLYKLLQKIAESEDIIEDISRSTNFQEFISSMDLN